MFVPPMGHISIAWSKVSLSHLVTASLISDIETSVNRCFAIVRLLILCAKCDGVGVILMKETNTPGLWRAFMANHREQNTVCAFQLSSNLTLYYYVIMFLSKVLLEQFLHSNTFLFWPVLCVGQWARQKIISHYFAVLLLLCYCIKKNELKTRLAQQSILSMTRLIY